MSKNQNPPPLRWYRLHIGTWANEELYECSTYQIFAQCRYMAWVTGLWMCENNRALISMDCMGTIEDYQCCFGDRTVEAKIQEAVKFEEWFKNERSGSTTIFGQ